MISIRKKQKGLKVATKSGWLQLSQKVDSGLVLLVQLAKNVSNEPLSLRTVAENTGLSFYFLQKVAADLRRAGIIEAGRGKNGGYTLSKLPKEVTMKDIVEAHEGPLFIMPCLHHGTSCPRESECNVRPGLNFINTTILQTLAQTSLYDFIHPTSWKTHSK